MSIYIKIDSIKGDVTAKNYQGWIDLDEYNFNSNKNITNRPGSLHNRSVSLPTLPQLIALKKTDCSSPLLFSNSCENKSLKIITIHNNRASSQLESYLEIKMYDAWKIRDEVHPKRLTKQKLTSSFPVNNEEIDRKLIHTTEIVLLVIGIGAVGILTDGAGFGLFAAMG